MQLVDGPLGVACTEMRLMQIKVASSPLAARIIQLVAKHPHGMHAFELAKQLHEHEQKVYYHTRRMVKAGILAVRHEDGRGGTAKILTLTAPAFAVRFGEWEQVSHALAQGPVAFLQPFIDDGVLNATLVVGSPDPHGPEQARSRDVHFAIDLGLFLGTFLTMRAHPAVALDTELRDWNQHLIIIGGIVVNKAAARINARSPARYDPDDKCFVIGKRRFGSENVGVIVKMPNPFAKGKWILHLAGRRHTGTKAAILAIINHLDQLGDVTVVEGVDADSDGVIESVVMLK